MDLKTHSTYRYTDTVCRGCGMAEENVSHVINCGESMEVVVEDVIRLEKVTPESCKNLQAHVKKIMSFIEEYSL